MKGKPRKGMLSKETLKSIKKGGLNFWVAENGANLSAGERQLVCFCRAILRKSKIVVLDEATANIDRATERHIKRLVAKEFKRATVLTIAHRIDTVLASDKVLVMDDGRCAEYASPMELISDPGSLFSQISQELRRKSPKKKR